MPNITVSTDINTLLTSTTLNASTEALGVLGAPVTATSITAKLGGTVPVANKIGNEFLKDTLQVDYISLTDHAGLTIPAATLAQKGGIAYFGNNPISEFRTARFVNGFTATGSSLTRYLIKSISVPASFNTLNNETALKFKFDVSGESLGANWAIQIVQAGSTSVTQGLVITVGAANAKIAVLEFDGYIICQAGKIFELRSRVKETISTSVDSLPSVGDKVTLLGVTNVAIQPEINSFAYATASTLQIYAVEVSATASDSVIIAGSFSIGPII
jgi:hypothetical protein